jgi:hypothetical protein
VIQGGDILLQKLLITASEEVVGHITRSAGIECVSYDGAEPLLSPGSVVVVLRPRADEQVTRMLDMLRDASVLDVPVIVVAGARDVIGEKFLREADLCGIPRECVLFVEDGRVVDADGAVAGNALRGRGIGVSVVVSVAEQALKKGLVPEMALWEEDGEGKKEKETVLWEPGTRLDSQNSGTEETEEQESPLDAFLATAGNTVAVFGIKNGVGATTVAACLSGVLTDHDSLHLEIAPSPSGYVYYGSSPLQAVSTGQYAFFDGSEVNGETRRSGVLVADVSLPKAVDAVYDRAECVVVVVDGSPISFQKVQSWIKGGYRLDILVVNRVVPGAGYPPEVYAGEFGLERVVGIPGGLDEESALNQAQHNGVLPLGKSIDLDTAMNELAKAVRDVLETAKTGRVAV